MIWLLYLALSGALAAISPRPHREALLTVGAGLVAVWGAKAYLSEPAFWIFLALIWVVIGAGIGVATHGRLAFSGLLLVVAGVLVAPARLMGHQHEIMASPYLVVSDCLGVLAILVLGGPALRRLVGGVWRLGHRAGISFARRAGAVARDQSPQRRT